jgi:hypothetical protein
MPEIRELLRKFVPMLQEPETSPIIVVHEVAVTLHVTVALMSVPEPALLDLGEPHQN